MRTSFHHQSEAQPPNGPLTVTTSPDTPSTCPARQSVCASAIEARHQAHFPDRGVGAEAAHALGPRTEEYEGLRAELSGLPAW